MNVGFVFGNGVSRLPVDFHTVSAMGKTYACNAFYRDNTPTVLVATDLPIATEIQRSGYAKTNRFYTRKPMADSGAISVPQKYYGYSSGPIALAIAATECDCLFMLGFDFGTVGAHQFHDPKISPKHAIIIEDNARAPVVRTAARYYGPQFNNIYAGTEFYKDKSSPPTYGGNWVRQVAEVVNDFQHVQVVRVIGTESNAASFHNLDNYSEMDIESFLGELNTPKDID